MLLAQRVSDRHRRRQKHSAYSHQVAAAPTQSAFVNNQAGRSADNPDIEMYFSRHLRPTPAIGIHLRAAIAGERSPLLDPRTPGSHVPRILPGNLSLHNHKSEVGFRSFHTIETPVTCVPGEIPSQLYSLKLVVSATHSSLRIKIARFVQFLLFLRRTAFRLLL